MRNIRKRRWCRSLVCFTRSWPTASGSLASKWQASHCPAGPRWLQRGQVIEASVSDVLSFLLSLCHFASKCSIMLILPIFTYCSLFAKCRCNKNSFYKRNLRREVPFVEAISLFESDKWWASSLSSATAANNTAATDKLSRVTTGNQW